MFLHYVSEFLPQALKLQGELHISHVLMNLRLEFEPIRAEFMNREISPDLDTCVQEVLREKLRLISQWGLTTQGSPYCCYL